MSFNRRLSLPSSVVLVLLAAVLVLASCGPTGTGDTTTTSTTTTTTVPTTTTSTEPPTTTTTTIPGEPIDIGPQAGDVLGVVGVEHDDVLNVRAAPGADQAILTTLDPLADDVVANGNAWARPGSIWFEVTVGEVVGWVHASYVAYLGDVDDAAYSEVVAALGAIPEAETMEELGMIVAEALASTDPPSRITMSVAATVGDLGEVTYDVVGLADDSVAGFRLHVFGQPADDGSGFSLMSVERTLLCLRGVSEGICV